MMVRGPGAEGPGYYRASLTGRMPAPRKYSVCSGDAGGCAEDLPAHLAEKIDRFAPSARRQGISIL